MKVENYKGNREFFRKVARESDKSRKKIQEIKSLKESSDKALEDMISVALMSGLYAALTVLILNGTFETNGAGKVIWPLLSALVVWLGISATKDKYKQRKSDVERVNKLIKEVIEEHPNEGITL